MSLLISAFLFLVMLVAGISNCSFMAGGKRTIYTAQCPQGLGIRVNFDLEKHPFDFERGDSWSYGLFYTAGSDELPLYGPVGAAPYVGWRYDDGHYSGPTPTFTFVPLPDPSDKSAVRVFSTPKRSYDHTRPPWRPDNPPFMNIFIHPTTMSKATFQDLATCLSSNETQINDALQNIHYLLPAQDRKSYLQLTLGGIVYGLPPYADHAYVEKVAAVWGDNTRDRDIPDHGRFTLYPGQAAHGVINGYNIVLSLDQNGSANLREVSSVSSQRKSVGAVISNFGSGGWLIAGPVCSSDLRKCGKAITPSGDDISRSVTFVINLRIGNNAFAEEPPISTPSRDP